MDGASLPGAILVIIEFAINLRVSRMISMVVSAPIIFSVPGYAVRLDFRQ